MYALKKPKLIKLIKEAQIHCEKKVTHGNPDRTVGGLVTVDYVQVTFTKSDWEFIQSNIDFYSK